MDPLLLLLKRIPTITALLTLSSNNDLNLYYVTFPEKHFPMLKICMQHIICSFFACYQTMNSRLTSSITLIGYSVYKVPQEDILMCYAQCSCLCASTKYDKVSALYTGVTAPHFHLWSEFAIKMVLSELYMPPIIWWTHTHYLKSIKISHLHK